MSNKRPLAPSPASHYILLRIPIKVAAPIVTSTPPLIVPSPPSYSAAESGCPYLLALLAALAHVHILTTLAGAEGAVCHSARFHRSAHTLILPASSQISNMRSCTNMASLCLISILFLCRLGVQIPMRPPRLREENSRLEHNLRIFASQLYRCERRHSPQSRKRKAKKAQRQSQHKSPHCDKRLRNKAQIVPTTIVPQAQTAPLRTLYDDPNMLNLSNLHRVPNYDIPLLNPKSANPTRVWFSAIQASSLP